MHLLTFFTTWHQWKGDMESMPQNYDINDIHLARVIFACRKLSINSHMYIQTHNIAKPLSMRTHYHCSLLHCF